MQTINYTNKSALNENAGIADVNKCNAADMNEIKSVVNANASECGNTSDLNTTDTSSIVNAVNEVNTGLGTKQAIILTGTSLPGTATDGTIFLLYS
jgi:hypothetical protein